MMIASKCRDTMQLLSGRLMPVLAPECGERSRAVKALPVTFDRSHQVKPHSFIAKPEFAISAFGASRRADRSDRNCASTSEPSARFLFVGRVQHANF